MTDEFVPFWSSLSDGYKRGLPRVAKYVYLELCQHARKRHGVVFLPASMGDVDGVHDLLGGAKADIVKALPVLAAPMPDSGDPMIRFTGPDGARVVEIVAYDAWTTDEDEGAEAAEARRKAKAAERARRYRSRAKDEPSSQSDAPATTDSTDSCVTPVTPTVTSRVTHAVTHSDISSSSEIRSEKRGEREESNGGVGVTERDASRVTKRDAERVFGRFLAGWRKHKGSGPTPILNDKRRQLITQRLSEYSVETLESALDGVWLDDFHQEKRFKYATLELVLRDAKHVEQFAALAPAPKAPTPPEPLPPPPRPELQARIAAAAPPPAPSASDVAALVAGFGNGPRPRQPTEPVETPDA